MECVEFLIFIYYTLRIKKLGNYYKSTLLQKAQSLLILHSGGNYGKIVGKMSFHSSCCMFHGDIRFCGKSNHHLER